MKEVQTLGIESSPQTNSGGFNSFTSSHSATREFMLYEIILKDIIWGSAVETQTVVADHLKAVLSKKVEVSQELDADGGKKGVFSLNQGAFGGEYYTDILVVQLVQRAEAVQVEKVAEGVTRGLVLVDLDIQLPSFVFNLDEAHLLPLWAGGWHDLDHLPNDN